MSNAPAAPNAAELERFYNALPHGRDQALTARELSARLGLSERHGDRVLRNLAQHATDAGYLVCTSNAGYYRPASADEAQETIGRLRSQAAHMSDRARRMQGLMDRLFGQQGRLL